ncbi:flagellar basal-body rod protein FlgF [Denitratisoma sp. agr-D3]
MDRLIYTAMSGASQTLSRQAAVSHNLANVSTTGYRSEEHRLRAVQVLTKTVPGTGAALPTRAFAVDASTHTDFSQGPMMETGRSLDLAVQGKGWIALSMPDGTEAYTRNGSMELSVNGILQTRNGIPVTGDGGPITIPPDSKIYIGKDGTISVVPETGAQNTVNTIGRIKLVNPPEETLRRGEDGLFRSTEGVQPVNERVSLASGFIENSNVNPVEQMVSMISLARQFEMQMKMVSSADQNDRSATQIINAR